MRGKIAEGMVPGARITQWCAKGVSEFKDTRSPGGFCLEGVVYGHPRITDGTRTRTAPMADFLGRMFLDEEDVLYVVEEPLEHWVQWLHANHIPFNADAPFRRVTTEELRARPWVPRE